MGTKYKEGIWGPSMGPRAPGKYLVCLTVQPASASTGPEKILTVEMGHDDRCCRSTLQSVYCVYRVLCCCQSIVDVLIPSLSKVINNLMKFHINHYITFEIK